MSSHQRWVHWCLCLLLITVIFSGLARKLVPHSVGILIFFFKDFVTLLLLLFCLAKKPNVEAARWLKIMGVLLALLVPSIIVTVVHDPILAVFGIKQYALFPAVAVAMCVAYLPNHRREFYFLFRLLAWSVVITTLVAVAQNHLPASHWLNLSVGGTDLSGFSAGGYLRVSSTFPFVGQYCYYLNAFCYVLPLYFFFKLNSRRWLRLILIIIFVGLFIVGTYVTGSRGSVIGNAAILTAGGLLALIFGGSKVVFKVAIPVIIGAILFLVLVSIYPQFFAAYETRMGGEDAAIQHANLEHRIISDLIDWTQGSSEAPPSFLGYGLGVMSNGSEKLSAYAAQWRDSGFWTESDRATTFFEGGWYLIVAWYGFRFWVIQHCLIRVLKLKRVEFRLIACFAWGFVLVIGVMGTLSIQPPLSIWWWLAVGTIICLSGFDRQPVASSRQLQPSANLENVPEPDHPFIITKP